MDCSNKPPIKRRHTYLDFLYYKLLTAVPLMVVLIGFWKTNPFMIIPYALWTATHITIVYRLLCTHCPHYGATQGRTNCLYLWGVPTVFEARTAPQNVLEKIGVTLLLFVSILFPVYWLLQNTELLMLYLLAIAVLLITMMRYECTRCAHTDCAHNRADA